MTEGGRHGDKGLDIGRKTMQPIYDFIGEAKKQAKPFLVWYAPMMPHDPHTPPERLLAKYKDKVPNLHIAKYYAMVDWFDETCGELVKHIDDQGLKENTIIVYVTDNGWITNPQTGRYADKSKQSQYDGGLRTPIMIRWPGKVKPRMHESLAQSIDLAPTLLKAAGLAPTSKMPGIDLLDDQAVTARTTIFGECFTHNYISMENPAQSSLKWRWIIDGHNKLILPHAANQPADVVELYEPMAEEEGGSLVSQTQAGLSVMGDRQLLSQALTNLLDNALKYGAREGETPQITVTGKIEADKVVITVADHGEGIPPEDRTRVTERFVRLDSSRSKPGNGLGLSLVSGVMKLHKGALLLEDNNPGLAARLVLPLHRPPDKGQPVQAR
jgi:hypothetical protein